MGDDGVVRTADSHAPAILHQWDRVPHVKAGRIRPLGVTSSKRVQVAPDLPTIAESGLPGFDTSQWFGFLAPAKTPQNIIDRLYQALTKATSSPEMKERLAANFGAVDLLDHAIGILLGNLDEGEALEHADVADRFAVEPRGRGDGVDDVRGLETLHPPAGDDELA